MGFGFSLGMIFIILPLTAVLLLLKVVSQKKIFGTILAAIWGGLISLIVLSYVLRPFFEKIVLEKEDYYGEYIIDRSFFPGKQADWQYNRFRFKIRKDDTIVFYVTEGKKILEIHKGVISSVDSYRSARLYITMNARAHHVLSDNPTTYRDIWDFYLVFHSPKYNNMFFKKGKWKSIEEKE